MIMCSVLKALSAPAPSTAIVVFDEEMGQSALLSSFWHFQLPENELLLLRLKPADASGVRFPLREQQGAESLQLPHLYDDILKHTVRVFDGPRDRPQAP